MNTDHLKEQGDINLTPARQEYLAGLDTYTQALIAEDARLFLHQALSTPVMNVIVRSEGPFLYDITGKQYLDMHGNGVHNAGFSNPAVMEAVKKQLDEKLAFTPRRYTNLPVIELARKLIRITPAGLDRVLFCPGGSEAIEMAVMLAKQITGKWKTISFWDSYHGTGFQAASLSGEEHFTVGNGPMVPGAFHVEFPNYYRNPWNWAEPERIDEEYLRQFHTILRRNPDIAAVVGEPISATPVIPSEHYWRSVQEICRKHAAFLIFDEIIEGFGRTGKMFACEHYVTPDVLVLGKSLGGGVVPFAGIVTRDEYNRLTHRSIGHYTHEKNPLCAAAGLAEIQYLEQHGLVQRSAELGDYFLGCLRELADTYPIIGHVAGKGLHLGIDLVKDRKTKERAIAEAERIMFFCMERGLAFKLIEGNVITLRPSLVIEKDHVDFTVRTLREAFEQVGV